MWNALFFVNFRITWVDFGIYKFLHLVFFMLWAIWITVLFFSSFLWITWIRMLRKFRDTCHFLNRKGIDIVSSVRLSSNLFYVCFGLNCSSLLDNILNYAPAYNLPRSTCTILFLKTTEWKINAWCLGRVKLKA